MIRILRKGEYELEDVLIRDRSGRDVSKVVEEILFSVKRGGDPTLLNYCETPDGARPESLELPAEEIAEGTAYRKSRNIHSGRYGSISVNSAHERRSR